MTVSSHTVPETSAHYSTRGLRPVLALLPALAAMLFLSLFTTGCGKREDPILRLSAEESLTMGKQFLEDEKYARARRT